MASQNDSASHAGGAGRKRRQFGVKSTETPFGLGLHDLSPHLADNFAHSVLSLMHIHRIGPLALSLLVSLPFLVPWHTYPIPSFYAEWWAAAIGLVAILALLNARSVPLPRVTLLLLSLAGVILLHGISGYAKVPQLAWLYVMYLVWAALLASASQHIAETYGVDRIVLYLAMALLIGAVFAALLSLFHQSLFSLGWIVFPAGQGGPIGQANHLTSYLWLGLTSALHLYANNRLKRVSFWAVVVLLVFTSTGVGQRSSFLYAFALLLVTYSMTRDPASTQDESPRKLMLVIFMLYFAMQPLAVMLPIWDAEGLKPPAALRAIQQASGPSIRLQLFRVGWEGIVSAPLLGNGVGSYPTLALEHAGAIPPDENPGPAESAHNIFIDLAVDLGIPIALLSLLAFGTLLIRLLKDVQTRATTWAIGVMAILGIHSLIEYPLWHTYFLGLFAIVFGVFGERLRIGHRLSAIAIVIGVTAWGGLMLYELKRDYRLLEYSLAIGGMPKYLGQAQTALLSIRGDSLLLPWVNTTACVSLDPLSVSLSDGLAVCNVAMNFEPSVESGVNLAVLLWRAGEMEAARYSLRNLHAATVHARGGAYNYFSVFAKRDARLEALKSNGPE